jgi:hypothetical protein
MLHSSIVNNRTRPVGNEEIHLWPAFLFGVSAEYLQKFKRQDLTLLGPLLGPREKGPASLEAVVLVDKKPRRTVEVLLKYRGFEIPDNSWWATAWTARSSTGTCRI